MKKLNITKEAFNKSKYFNNKYGELKYVSESGKLFKTTKGNVLRFVKESSVDDVDTREADDGGTYIINTCPFCHKQKEIHVDLTEWDVNDRLTACLQGALIQNAFPMLSPDEREFIKTGICQDCWEQTVGSDDESEEYDESRDSDWFGIKGARFVYHGEWADPEVIYDGVSLNYYDIEDMLIPEYREEYPEDRDCDGLDLWLEKPSTRPIIQSVLDVLVQDSNEYA